MFTKKRTFEKVCNSGINGTRHRSKDWREFEGAWMSIGLEIDEYVLPTSLNLLPVTNRLHFS